MKKVTVNSGRDQALCDIDKVEEKYKAKFVGQLALKTQSGGWSSDTCGDVYYQVTPPHDGWSNYFALIVRGKAIYITSGASAVDGLLTAVIADDGEIVYSRYRHDFRRSTDNSVFIDGGRDYVKGSITGQYVNLKIIDGEFYQLEPMDEIT